MKKCSVPGAQRTGTNTPESSTRTPLASGLSICAWYRNKHRDLPWRRTKNPYHILVSEIMLQQTRVETVIGYWHRFLEAFPDIETLAEAETERVMSRWQGLGYYSRARNLQRAAQQVCGQHGGSFPASEEALRQLPGIGPYTAGAMMSLAFDKPVPAVDGNVLRVMSRVHCLESDISQTKTVREVTRLVAEMIPSDQAADFCQGMMELGATVCTPTVPSCDSCPLCGDCLSHARGQETAYPIKRSKPAPVSSWQAVFVVLDAMDRVLLQYRREGLLSGLWGLPHFEAEAEVPDLERLREWLAQEGLLTLAEPVLEHNLGVHVHTFTHRRWHMRVWQVRLGGPSRVGEESESNAWQWVLQSQLAEKPIPEAFRKVLQAAGLSASKTLRKKTVRKKTLKHPNGYV